jgi:hypothetical protein
MNVYISFVFVLFYVGTALARDQYPIQGVLPNAFKIPKFGKL